MFKDYYLNIFDPPVIFETSRTICFNPSKTNGYSGCPHDVINCAASVRSCQCRGGEGGGSALTLLSLLNPSWP